MSKYKCMCGATDCASCGPAQGYTVVKVWDAKQRRMVYRNPEPEDEQVDPREWNTRDENEES